MSDFKYPLPARVAVGRALCSTLLDFLIEPMRTVARDCGYAIAVHGSLARDIDLVAIPWTDQAVDPELLVTRLAAVASSIVGRCNPSADWVKKPHGRRAVTLLLWGGDQFGHVDIDLSIMPCVKDAAA